MNTLVRLVCSAVALMSASAFAQTYTQTKPNNAAQKPCPSSIRLDEGLSNQYSPAYNAPAMLGIDNGWDVYLRAAFIYWNVNQEYMEVARSAQYAGIASGVAATPFPAIQAKVAIPSTNYEPGFKVAVGYNTNYDGWTTEVEYTWLHQTTSATFGTTPSSLAIGAEIWIPNDWFNALSVTTRAQASEITTKWKMNLDMVDWTAGRPFYQSRLVKVSPYGGLRGLWIRQNYTITANNVLNLAFASAQSRTLSQCWSVGPTGGVEGQWMVGYGIRVEGDTGVSILYTRYTKLVHNENDQQTLTGVASIPGALNPYGCLRPTLDMGLGFGWGMFFYDRTYHIDFSAKYDFMFLWSQNVMRYMVGTLANNNVGYPDPTGDLYLHGLTFKARFDF